MQTSARVGRGAPTVVRLVVLIASAGLAVLAAACGTSGNQAPATTTTKTTTTTTPSTTVPPPAPPASPTEKSLSPSFGNLFTPTVLAPPAPTELPGGHRH